MYSSIDFIHSVFAVSKAVVSTFKDVEQLMPQPGCTHPIFHRGSLTE